MFANRVCRNCGYRLDADETLCPACQTISDSSDFSFEREFWTYIGLGITLLIAVCVFLYDYHHGTRILPALGEFFGGPE